MGKNTTTHTVSVSPDNIMKLFQKRKSEFGVAQKIKPAHGNGLVIVQLATLIARLWFYSP